MTDISWLTERPIAHRGLHDLNNTCWENTPCAFEAAARKGYAIECDVHLTKDGVPVVFHDNGLRRLTGTDGFVWQRTAAEMRALRVGGTENHVPTLAEMLSLVAGRVPVVIELKGVAGKDGGFVSQVARALAGYRGRVAIMSFDHWLVREFADKAPGVPAGLTAEGTEDSELEMHFSMLAHGVSFVSYNVKHLPNRFVRFVQEKLHMPVITWTVRDQAAVEQTFAHAGQMTFEGFEPPLHR